MVTMLPAAECARWTVVPSSHDRTRFPRPIELRAELDRLTPSIDIPDLLARCRTGRVHQLKASRVRLSVAAETAKAARL
jgi:hypothetical protein